MKGRSLYRGSTFTFTRDLLYIASISLTPVKFTCVRTYELRESGKPLLDHLLQGHPVMYMVKGPRGLSL